MGSYSALAGGIALAVLMLPTVTLTAEGAMSMVPQKMKDAAIGMGCTQAQVVWSVTVPTALPSVVTGIILSVARVAGESAPLLFTALFSNYWLRRVLEPTASLSILIYNFSSMPFDNQIQLAWAASLVLVVIVLGFNILSRFIGRPPSRSSAMSVAETLTPLQAPATAPDIVINCDVKKSLWLLPRRAG